MTNEGVNRAFPKGPSSEDIFYQGWDQGWETPTEGYVLWRGLPSSLSKATDQGGMAKVMDSSPGLPPNPQPEPGCPLELHCLIQ